MPQSMLDDLQITSHGAKALQKYKYNAEDRSLLYKYVLSDFAQWCVNFVPKSIA